MSLYPAQFAREGTKLLRRFTLDVHTAAGKPGAALALGKRYERQVEDLLRRHRPLTDEGHQKLGILWFQRGTILTFIFLFIALVFLSQVYGLVLSSWMTALALIAGSMGGGLLLKARKAPRTLSVWERGNTIMTALYQDPEHLRVAFEAMRSAYLGSGEPDAPAKPAASARDAAPKTRVGIAASPDESDRENEKKANFSRQFVKQLAATRVAATRAVERETALEDPADDRPRPAPVARPAAEERKRVLIVDEGLRVEEKDLKALREKFWIEIHADPQTAIRRARSVSPDLVLLSLRWREADPISLAQGLLEAVRETPARVGLFEPDETSPHLSEAQALGIGFVVQKVTRPDGSLPDRQGFERLLLQSLSPPNAVLERLTGGSGFEPRRTVVVIADSEEWKELCRGLLEGTGYAIEVLPSSEDVVRAVADLEPVAFVVDNRLTSLESHRVYKMLRLGTESPIVMVVDREEEAERFELILDRPLTPRKVLATLALIRPELQARRAG